MQEAIDLAAIKTQLDRALAELARANAKYERNISELALDFQLFLAGEGDIPSTEGIKAFLSGGCR
jgi:hypothetical protein